MFEHKIFRKLNTKDFNISKINFMFPSRIENKGYNHFTDVVLNLSIFSIYTIGSALYVTSYICFYSGLIITGSIIGSIIQKDVPKIM